MVTSIIIFIYFFLAICYIMFKQSKKIKDLRYELTLKQINIDTFKNKYERDVTELYLRNKKLINEFNVYKNDPLIKKALRMAMINSHPDKGGNTEEFIRFKDLYDKVK